MCSALSHAVRSNADNIGHPRIVIVPLQVLEEQCAD